ncbi:MAG: hypothetical protein K2F87_05660, partial [Muribaculaceae bacterium]|nr:hypothetical protein [Muribaculaceae bacterium]
MVRISPNNRQRGASHYIITRLAVCLVCIFTAGCVKNEFRMLFDLPESVNSTYRLTYYASDPRGGLQVETAVAVAAGKGDVKGITRYPTLVALWAGPSDIPALIF